MKLKYILSNLMFLRTYNSPFKPLKLKWYFGKTKIGVPIFLPRIWKKYTDVDCIKSTGEALNNPNLTKRTPEAWMKYYKNYSKAVPRKIGFDFSSLMFKTKWTDVDFRHEYNPVWSFVCFGYQIAVTFYSHYDGHYFEPFLFYHLATDKTKSREDRIKECRDKFSCTWTSHINGKKETIDYYELILKKKYLK